MKGAKMQKYETVGLKYVAIGILCFAVVLSVVGLLGWYKSPMGAGVAMAVMAVMVMGATKTAYFAGKKDSADSSNGN